MKQKIKYWFFVLMGALVTMTPVFAISESQLDMFAQNGILFYDPTGSEIGSCVGGTSATTGNTDYAGNEILNADQLQKIAENQPIYEKVGADTGIPWAVFAVIHMRESSLSRTNPKNNLGIYQITDNVHYYAWTGTPVDDAEFERQTRDAAEHLQGKMNDSFIADGLAAGDPNAVKRLFFAYNGKAGVYKNQAISLGFSSDEAENGEGSPYVMNRADLQRDTTVEPTKSNRTWGQIKVDYGPIEYPANTDYGAFVVYASLAGLASGCGLTEGGMTEEQAKTFMMRYGENVNNDSVTAMSRGAMPATDCAGGALSNCVSFSAFFLGKFTDSLYAGGNGVNVVSRMRDSGVPTGTEPRVYAVFSWADGDAGHTGVVLGIHGDTVIVGHASCSSSNTGMGDGTKAGGGAGWAMTGSIADTGPWLGIMPAEFAYPENVNTSLITEYINNGP